jgi:hypothetical protein
MRMIIAVLAAGALLTGCVSSSGSNSRPPNYVSSQATQPPRLLNDAFGGAAADARLAFLTACRPLRTAGSACAPRTGCTAGPGR